MVAILFSPPEGNFGPSTTGVPLKSRFNAKMKAKSVLYLVNFRLIHLIEGRRTFLSPSGDLGIDLV